MGEDMEISVMQEAMPMPEPAIPVNPTRNRLAGRTANMREPQPITTVETLDMQGEIIAIISTDLNFPDMLNIRIGSSYGNERFVHFGRSQLRKLRTIINQYLGDDDAK